jgi:ABC-type branched-subunit amino acid transport system substrate-binding protein
MLSMVALVSACGNRNDYQTLKEAATGVSVAQAGTDGDVPVGPAATAAKVSPSTPRAIVGAPAATAVQVSPSAPRANVGTPAATPTAGVVASVTGAGPAAPGRALAPSINTGKAAASTLGRGGSGAASAVCTKSLAPIKIASIGHYSGVAGALMMPGLRGLQVWVSWKNAAGGVACHPVQLSVGDDGTDPAKTQSLAREFVEQKGVVAFVHMSSSFTGQTIVDYLTQRRIPVFGSEGGSDWFNEHETYFPQMTTGSDYVESSFALPGALQAPNGKTKLAALTCFEAPACSSAYGLAPKFAEKYGMQLVYRAQVSITEPNYTSNCLAAKNAGAQVLWFAFDGASAQRVARSCESVGFHPVYAAPAVALTPSQASYPALSGVELAVPILPWIVTSNRAMAEFLAAIAKYAPGFEPSAGAVQGWVSAQVFAEAASKVDAQPTSAQILQGAFQIKNNDFGGLTRKLTYTAGASNQRQSQLCWWAVQFDGSKVTSPNGGKETCGS